MLQKISISNKCCHGIMALDHVTLKTGGITGINYILKHSNRKPILI